MNYRHVYMLIIEHAKSEQKLGLRPKNLGRKDKKNFTTYFELHHILPKSLFPLWFKRKSNVVPLTAREHFFCHQLLTKIYPCKQMIYALHMLCIDKQNNYCNIGSKEYERIRINFSQALSESLKGNTYAKGNIGYRAVHKNGIITRVPISELNKYLLDDWQLGTGLSSWNRGMTMPPEIVEKYKASHAYLKKPKIKKEKTKRKSVSPTLETKQKISRALTGIKRTNEQLVDYKKAARARALSLPFKILLVNTGEIFDCLKDARDKYPQGGTHICDCLSGKRSYAGLLNGEKMIWQKINK